MNRVRWVTASVAILALTACSEATPSASSTAPELLAITDLPSGWRSVQATGALPICDVSVPPRSGRKTTQLVAFLSPDQRTLLSQALVTYKDTGSAAAAVDAVRTLPAECPATVREDGTELALRALTVPGHETPAVLVLASFADGSGQAFALVASQHGTVAQFVTVDSPQGGVPTANHIADMLDLVAESA